MPPNPIPPIPPEFLARMQRLLGDEYPAFARSLEQKPLSGLRVNTLKLTPAQFQAISPFPLGEKVPWCDSAFLLRQEQPVPGYTQGDPGEVPPPLSPAALPLVVGKHPYHLAGLYYLQDPSAMSAAELLLGCTPARPDLRVLDLAAAPGGKTTHLACLMHGTGLLVANEIKDKRVGHLAVNVERWGAGNVVITNETPERLSDHFGAFFDRVLVDAPCSGEGMFRKDMGARRDWSPEMVAGCAIRQRNILRVAAKLVRPDGYLLYSTCTFAPEEDEAVINELITAQPDFEVVELPLLPGFQHGRPDWAGAAESLRGAVRLFPHQLDGEGHFACLLHRAVSSGTEDWDSRSDRNSDRLACPSEEQERLWQEFTGQALTVSFDPERLRVRAERLYFTPPELPDLGRLRVLHPGVWLGTFKTARFEPAHPLALFLSSAGTPSAGTPASNVLDLSPDSPEIAAYLGGQTLPCAGPSGWTLVTVNGWPLGWGKRVQGILKNHYPRGWQIYS